MKASLEDLSSVDNLVNDLYAKIQQKNSPTSGDGEILKQLPSMAPRQSFIHQKMQLQQVKDMQNDMEEAKSQIKQLNLSFQSS
mmetsp:Transcript_24214/g.23794  ORF Transcript_24214/g.23794 Transcript_24214/m.23794 type:complete len:83 (+) Transcript_24214:1196-1444(+)